MAERRAPRPGLGLTRAPILFATASERGRIIWKIGDLIEAHLEEFAELVR